MAPRRSKPRLALLVWEDIAPHDGSWVQRKTVRPNPAVMESVGWLIREDNQYVVLAQDFDHKDDMVAGLATYPRGCVKSLSIIGEQDG